MLSLMNFVWAAEDLPGTQGSQPTPISSVSEGKLLRLLLGQPKVPRWEGGWTRE